MEGLYRIYQNIMLFASPKYRNINLDKPIGSPNESPPNMPEKQFTTVLRQNEYILHSGHNSAGEGVYLLIFMPNSKFIKTKEYRDKLLSKLTVTEPKCHLYIFSDQELSTHVRKNIRQYKNISTKMYLFVNFTIEINRGPLCSVHKILSKEQSESLCQALKTTKMCFPKIYENDPQIIWIGGEVGDVIEIRSRSYVAGQKVYYRVVIKKK